MVSGDAHPSEADWGRKQFGAYLGGDPAGWAPHDATLLMRERGFPGEQIHHPQEMVLGGLKERRRLAMKRNVEMNPPFLLAFGGG